MQQEAIKLRLGQWIGALLFNWVLGCHHQEQGRQGECIAANRDLTLAHRFKQGRLHFGWRAVDLIREDDIVKEWPALEFELARLWPIDFGAG